MRFATSMSTTVAASPGFGLLFRLKLTLLRNRIRQLLDQSPLGLTIAIVFIGVIWIALYAMFENVFSFLRRFEQSAVLAVPYVFHIFFMAMTLLLTFSTAVLVYSAMFGREEPMFLLSMPQEPRNIVTVLYLEGLFFASWSLLLLGLPLMAAIGQVQGLPWHFYVIFVAAFLGFVPIPGALGLLAALAVALWLPRLARQTLIYTVAAALVGIVIWWGRLWAISAGETNEWLRGFLSELSYLKPALLPSTWVTHAIRYAIEDKPGDAVFYLAVTAANALFFSWLAITLAGRGLLMAFGRAHSAPARPRRYRSAARQSPAEWCFGFVPAQMRLLIVKDVRNFLRDPMQWSQLVILFGLLTLYLAYLPRSKPEGFSNTWQALICFLNYGAVTLILSTFTSRFVFPMISMEGRQMWLVALWPLSRDRVLWSKFLYALLITGSAAFSVTILSIYALDLPPVLALVQLAGTVATCVGLCGLAVGLGASMPCYHESSSGRIASGLGGTINLVSSVGLVAVSLMLVGGICYRMVRVENLTRMDGLGWLMFFVMIALGPGVGFALLRVGIRRFQAQQF